jgi:hypothetical protein
MIVATFLLFCCGLVREIVSNGEFVVSLPVRSVVSVCRPASLELVSKVTPFVGTTASFNPPVDTRGIAGAAVAVKTPPTALYLGRLPSTVLTATLEFVEDGATSCAEEMGDPSKIPLGDLVVSMILSKWDVETHTITENLSAPVVGPTSHFIRLGWFSHGNFSIGWQVHWEGVLVGESRTAFEFGIGMPSGGEAGCLPMPGTQSVLLPDADPATKKWPLLNIPRAMCADFTMDYRVPISRWFFDDSADVTMFTGAGNHRGRDEIDGLVDRARRREAHYYGAMDTWLWQALDAYDIAGMRILIIGSTMPWYEAICIEAGAAECWTLEYNKLDWDHPNIHTVEVIPSFAFMLLELIHECISFVLPPALKFKGVAKLTPPPPPAPQLFCVCCSKKKKLCKGRALEV